MFPVHKKYISEYHSHKQVVKIDYDDIPKAHKEAKKVIGLLNRGIKFTQTSPDIERIKQVQLKQEQMERQNDVQKDLGEFVKNYQLQENEQNQGRKL